MIGSVIFSLLLLLPFVFYLANAARVRMESRGIVLQPKTPREPKAPRRTKLRVVNANSGSGNCGRHWTHFFLALTLSGGSCRYCTPDDGTPATPPPGDGSEPSDAVAAAERILDDANRH